MTAPAPTTLDRVRQAAVVLTLAAVLWINYLATALPLRGRNTGEISDLYPSLVTPAGYVFAIWGVIYLALIGYAIYQALPARATDRHLRAIGWLFVVNGLLNMLWLWLWHGLQTGASLVVMVGILGSLIAIYVRLRDASPWLRLPFSIYLGWISVATIANTSIALLDAGWGGFGIAEVTWAVLILGVGAALASLMAWRERDIAYVAVFVWAYAGIAVARAGEPTVARAAWLMIPIFVAVLGARLLGVGSKGEVEAA